MCASSAPVSRQIVLNMAATGNEEQTLLPDIEEEAEGMEREMESEEEEGMGVEHSEEEDEADTSEDERENEAEIQRLEEQVRGMNEANDSPRTQLSKHRTNDSAGEFLFMCSAEPVKSYVLNLPNT